MRGRQGALKNGLGDNTKRAETAKGKGERDGTETKAAQSSYRWTKKRQIPHSKASLLFIVNGQSRHCKGAKIANVSVEGLRTTSGPIRMCGACNLDPHLHLLVGHP